MRLVGRCAVTFIALLGTGRGGAQERRDVPTFASKVELVTVDAVVVDGKGQPVRGLRAEDFTLREDGKPQAIASFEAFDLGDAPEAMVGRAATSPVATNLRPARAGARSFVLLVDDMSLAPTRQNDSDLGIVQEVAGRCREANLVVYSLDVRGLMTGLAGNGDVIREGPATAIAPSPDGRLVRLLALSLEDMAPGDYEFVLRVEDKATGQIREQIEPLRIVPRAG